MAFAILRALVASEYVPNAAFMMPGQLKIAPPHAPGFLFVGDVRFGSQADLKSASGLTGQPTAVTGQEATSDLVSCRTSYVRRNAGLFQL